MKKPTLLIKIVSIGPFHHNGDGLKDMEMQKLRYFKDFLYRTGNSQEDLLKIIIDDEAKIRHCYSEDCGLNSVYFVKMILLDAIFLIELFLKVRDQKNREDEEDYILRKIWLANAIYYDLLLLENQLPFFVLEKLYKLAFNDSSSFNHCEEGKPVEEHKKDLQKEDAPIVKLFRNYLTYYDQKRRKSIGDEVIEESTGKEKTKAPICEEVKHFTDGLRYLFCPPYMEKYWHDKNGTEVKWNGTALGSSNCATKLDDIGLKFKVKDDTRLLDITVSEVILCTCLVKDDRKDLGCLARFPCLGTISCLFACLPCLICLICFPSLTSLLGCLGCPMHILEVPQLVINYGTEAIFRNFMALKQCHYPSKTYICNYVLLLDSLIDTKKDVDLLVDNKVIANHLGNNGDVATLINKLAYEIVATPSYFNLITKKLNEHYEFPLNHLLATLEREYFPNIFRGTTTIVGLIVLGFTLWSFIRSFVNE